MTTPYRKYTMESADSDTYSIASAATSMSIGDSLPDQLVRKSARKGFTFNIMAVGPAGMGKTALLSSLFMRNLEISKQDPSLNQSNNIKNLPISIESKIFDIDDKRVRLKLNLVESRNYGESLTSKDIFLPLVNYIDNQFSDYHKRELGFDRRNIQDNMVHCLFFFISPICHGITELDLEFLKAVHGRVNIVPIIGKAESLTLPERASLKRRIRDSLERAKIQIYRMPDPAPDDPDHIKRTIKDIQDCIPFAITSMSWNQDNGITGKKLDYGYVDPFDKSHSDFLMLRQMLNMQMADLCETTHEVFYEEYRLRKSSHMRTLN